MRRRLRRRGRPCIELNIPSQINIKEILPIPNNPEENILIKKEDLEILKKYEYENKTLDEIAEELGISKPSVWRIINRTKKDLFKALFEGKKIIII